MNFLFFSLSFFDIFNSTFPSGSNTVYCKWWISEFTVLDNQKKLNGMGD